MDNYIYVAARNDNAIVRIATDGTKTTVVSGLTNPRGVHCHVDTSTLYIADCENTASIGLGAHCVSVPAWCAIASS